MSNLWLWPPSRQRRRWVSTAAVGVGAAATGYYIYQWWTHGTSSFWRPEPEVSLRAPLAPVQLPQDANQGTLYTEADKNLQNHFDSIQIISERTTFPQMLLELVKGLGRIADVGTLIMRLKSMPAGTTADPAAESAKVQTWEQLKLLSFTRLICIIWLVPLLDLLLRVQLNILGRHLFLESHLLDRAAAQAWVQTANGPRRVTKRAQELFLEVAHYLPERGTAVVGERIYKAVEDALGDTKLDRTLTASQLLDCLSAIHAEFEGWAVQEGWPEVVLPSSGEAAQYFGGSLAPPDNQALVHNPSAEADEDIARRMVGELHTILASAKFAAAAQAAVQEMARAVATALVGESGSSAIPLAKLIPRVVATSDAFMAGNSPARSQALASVAQLDPVQKLCATVYSCGPPL